MALSSGSSRLALRRGQIETFWRLGVRTIQLTYNTRSYIGDGVFEDADAGLSKFGRAAVTEMNRVGILIDLSHVGRRTSLDAIEVSQKPCVFTHSNPHARKFGPVIPHSIASSTLNELIPCVRILKILFFITSESYSFILAGI